MNPIGDSVRVRFAPSPTGYLHVGGARTAIFNWLWARHMGGTFVLRIEDTDAERSTRASADSLIDDLLWLGLDWDEGPGVGGLHGPYRQSERIDIYAEVAASLVESGHAFPCFCTDDILERKRQEALAAGRPPQYDGTCRDYTADEVETRRASGAPEVVRFRVPRGGRVLFDDIVRGAMSLEHHMVGDFVLLRSNRLPTYNFAAAVDDHRMEITHVIRGEDHLSNTLRQILIYDAMGVAQPTFAHVPLIVAEDRSKLSKRHGSASVGELRARGLLPSAVFNYLVLLGWSHPEGREVLARDEMIEAFTVERIGRASAVFDTDKLLWVNGQHTRKLDPVTLYELAAPHLPAWMNELYDDATRRAIVATLQDSIDSFDHLGELCAVFADPVESDDEAREVLADAGAKEVLRAFATSLADLDGELTPEAFKSLTKATGKETGRKGKDLFFPLRAAITGCLHGPDLSRVASIKGRDRVGRAVGAPPR